MAFAPFELFVSPKTEKGRVVATGGSGAGPTLGPGHPSDWCLLTPCQGRRQARLRVSVCQAASTVRGCPAVTDGLDGELEWLQDRGTGGMAPLATPHTTAGLAALRPSRTSLGIRCELGAAVARQGLRAAGGATGSVSGSPKVPSQLRTVGCAACGTAVSLRGAFVCPVGQLARRAPGRPLGSEPGRASGHEPDRLPSEDTCHLPGSWDQGVATT
jgi:hypothetical protein